MQLTAASAGSASALVHLKPFSPLPPPKLLHRRGLDVIITSCTSPRTSPSSYSSTQQDVLTAIAESNERVLPCVRTYENDSARLSLVGAVGFEQALTAAAADGGGVASEHLDAGVPAMVVETILPGSMTEEHATVSTRLFLPARKVKEKAKKLKNSITDDMLATTTPRNIFAMTFKQVVMQQLWNFELAVFQPGAERDMDDLEAPRKVPESFVVGSSNEHVISVLAEAACKSTLQITEQDCLENGYGRSLNFFNWFNKPKGISSSDSLVVIYKLGEDEIVENAKSLLEHFSSARGNPRQLPKSSKRSFGWTKEVQSKLENIGGIEFCAWVHEYIPAYRLEINCDKLSDLRLEGWQQLERNAQEVILTHSQMVGLVNILDMFYEDIYTLPDKELSCGMVVNPTILSNKKRHLASLKILATVLAGVIFVITVRAFGGVHLPFLRKEQVHAKNFTPVPPSETYGKCNDELDQRSDIVFFDFTHWLPAVARKLGIKSGTLLHEIEGPYVAYLEFELNKPILLAGVLPKPPASSLDERWLKWLNIFNPGSVIYCTFGSEWILKRNQFQELILGLELTQKPFFAALKPPIGVESTDSALPPGLMDRIHGRGVIHEGWVQQPLNLEHPSLGCFLMDCGSGSLLDGMIGDCKPVILPHKGDQFINARMMSDGLKVGVLVERMENGSFIRDTIHEVIRSVTDEDNEIGKEVRRNHGKWKELLLREGLEDSYMEEFAGNSVDCWKGEFLVCKNQKCLSLAK